MTELVVQSAAGEVVTDTVKIAEGTENQHKNVLSLVRLYQRDLEEFGGVAFETRPFETPGGTQSQAIAILNEEQALLVLTYMRNSVIIREFKKLLVREFVAMRHALLAAEQAAIEVKPLTGLEYARRLVAAEEQLEDARRAQLAAEQYADVLEPIARSYMVLATAQGDLDVDDAAKVLKNEHGIDTGEHKLYRYMNEHGWVFKERGRWKAYQTQVNNGRLSMKHPEEPYWNAALGEWCNGEPKVQITQKGLHELRLMMVDPVDRPLRAIET